MGAGKTGNGGKCSLSVKVLHGTMFVPVLMYGSEKKLWKEKDLELRLYRFIISDVF